MLAFLRERGDSLLRSSRNRHLKTYLVMRVMPHPPASKATAGQYRPIHLYSNNYINQAKYFNTTMKSLEMSNQIKRDFSSFSRENSAAQKLELMK